MPQCKDCFAPIVSGALCRPCRDERTDDDDITQEIPIPMFEDDGGAVPPLEDEQLFDTGQPLNQDELQELRKYLELLGGNAGVSTLCMRA